MDIRKIDWSFVILVVSLVIIAIGTAGGWAFLVYQMVEPGRIMVAVGFLGVVLYLYGNSLSKKTLKAG